MVAPDPAVVERNYWLNLLGWTVDNPALSMQDLRDRWAASQIIDTLDTNIRLENQNAPLASSIKAAGGGGGGSGGGGNATDNGDGSITLDTTPSATLTKYSYAESTYQKIAGGGGGGGTATDNADGGITINTTPPAKLTKYTYGESAYLKVANAIPLATTTPLKSTVTGYPGTAATASRGDHVHPVDPAAGRPYGIGISSGIVFGTCLVAAPAGSQLNRGCFGPLWLTLPGGGPLNCAGAAIQVMTAGAAGATMRFGMWGVDAAGSLDFTKKIFETAEIPCATTGFKTYAFTATIQPGLYWVGNTFHTAGGTLVQSANTGMITYAGAASGSGNSLGYLDGITGAYPTTGGINTNGDYIPYMWFTAA